MIVKNASKMFVVLADSTKHYASLSLGKQTYLDDSTMDVQCIADAIQNGMIKVVCMGGKPEPMVSQGIPSRAAKVEQVISRIVKNEVDDDTDEEAISGVSPKQASDYTPPVSSGRKAKIVDLGQKLIKKGGSSKKKLVSLVRPEETEVVKRPPKFIKLRGDGGDVALDAGGVDGTLIINESGIPGQARTVRIADANDEDLEKVGKMTSDLLEEAATGRKIAVYMTNDEETRERFVEATTDVAFLKEIAKIEWQGKVAKAIREKMAELGVSEGPKARKSSKKKVEVDEAE